MKNISDETLIMLYQSRSEIAISETKTKYGKLIFAVAKGIIQNDADSASLPTNVDAELLAKVLSNPEMAALLTTLAKTLESK